MDRHLGYLFFFTSMALMGQVVVEPEIDTTAPIIQTWDYTSRHILVGDPFEDHGVTAWDETDGEIEVVLSGNLDTSTVGVYTQTYTATDSSGNIASESQTIFVVGSREELLVFIDNDDGQTTVLFTADPSIRGDLEVPATWQGKSVVEVNSLAWCDKLTSVTLPDSVTHLGYGAFQSCTSLKSIHIGAGLSTFGEWVFNADCDSLTAITVSANNQNYTSVDGALYSKDMKTLYSVPEGTTGEFVVSEEVIRLEDTAFAGCKKLSSILFKGLTAPSLGTDVFEGLQMSYGDWFGYAKRYEGATGYEAGDYALIDFTTVSLEPEDTEAPILGLNGQAEVVLEYPAGYVEEGAQAQDAVDGQVAVTISGEVNPQQLGEYKLTYTAVDNAGNTASTTRTVTVVDTTGPVITLIGG